MKKQLSYSLVIIQFYCILYLAQNAANIYHDASTLIPVISGMIILLWAVWEMKKSKLQIFPDVERDATLIKTGPYKLIRHPMYTGVILLCLGLLISNITIGGIFFFIILLIDLVAKLHYEEKLLIKHFAEYTNYRKKTKKLIPYIY